MTRLIFITGASSGIGQALALQYYEQGCALALCGRSPQRIAQWLDANGMVSERCQVYGADVSEMDSVIAAARRCMQVQGLPDVVIASAGISIGMDSRERSDLDVMAQTLHTNVLGMAATFHPFIEPMRLRGSGRLVGISSVAAVRGLPGHGAYCASKAAVSNYCESLRGELRGSGVRVVTLVPGYVDTPMTQGNRYPMPFLITPATFAKRAAKAIVRGASTTVIPGPMRLIGLLLRALPNWLFDALLAGRPRKQRKTPSDT